MMQQSVSTVGRVALAHDYATQRGGAERVALVMAEAFPDSPLYTTLYDPDGTFPEFASISLRPSRLNRIPTLRANHRLALPMLAPAVSAERIDADVLLASSSGWAHGYRGAERTVVYCYTPARWLYFRDRYLSARPTTAKGWARHGLAHASLQVLGPSLRAWDRRATKRADKYLACSTIIARAIEREYGIEAEVLAPPPAMLPAGSEREVDGVAPGFLLCVARLLPYKNVDVVIEAAQRLGGPDLVVVGDGPDRERLSEMAARPGSVRVHLLGRVDDEQLRWLYRHASTLIAASYEDFGLSPLEANAFGRPAVALRAGGFLDSIREGHTGEYFDTLDTGDIAAAIDRTLRSDWDRQVLTAHADAYGVPRFQRRLHEIVAEQLASVSCFPGGN